MMRKTVAAIAALGGLAVLTMTILPVPGPAGLTEAAPAAPARASGLKLTIRPQAAGAATDVRVARMVALRVPEGTPPTPFTKPGPFTAVWEGAIVANFRDDYAFSADGRGKFSLTVNGAVVLETSGEDLSTVSGKTVQLQKGENTIVARYESPAAGDAWVRLFWTPAETKLREPIPWLAWAGKRVHDPTDPALREAGKLRQGRELLVTLRCLKCHAEGAASAAPGANDMPELSMDAPSLKDAGARLNGAWLTKWLLDPRALRPDTAMPACLAGPDADAQAAHIAAYLATLGAAGKPEEPPTKEAAAAGGKLFAQLGCVSCHTLPTRDDWATVPDRIPLRNVSAKWQPAALRAFLRQPDKHYQWIRMPNFGFSEEEAGKLASYILSAPPSISLKPGPAGDPKLGAELVVSTGCANCHALPTEKRRPAPGLKDIKHWSDGCLNPTAKRQAAGAAPRYQLTDTEREAIITFAATDRSSLHREALPEFAERQIRLLRCLACHKRDDRQEDPWTDLSEETEQLVTDGPPDENPDEARHFPPEQIRPSLTWTGEKLRPEWTAAFIGGKLGYKPRLFLRARMPAFPQRAAALAQGLALDHGYPTTSREPPPPDAAQAEIGRQLAKKSGGLSCTSCHDVGKTEAVGVFEAPGVNLMLVRERLNKPYYDRWMYGPLRVEPGTKMPVFYKEGKTDITGVLGGDAHKQFAALWQFLLTGHDIKAPDE